MTTRTDPPFDPPSFDREDQRNRGPRLSCGPRNGGYDMRFDWAGIEGAGSIVERLDYWHERTGRTTFQPAPLLRRFAAERKPGERFGDFCDRVILKEPLAEN